MVKRQIIAEVDFFCVCVECWVNGWIQTDLEFAK